MARKHVYSTLGVRHRTLNT